MADYVALLGTMAALALATTLVWRRVAGPAPTPFRNAGRIALAVSLAVVLTGAAAYQLSKARTLQLAPGLVYRVKTSQKVVALTFDDGPTAGHTQQVLDVLASHDASATFYVTGRECEENPRELRAIADAGHELGNHTYSHGRMLLKPVSAVANEIERTDALIESAGYTGPITFRPPGCKRLVTTPGYLARTGRMTVTWDLEPDSIAGLENDPEALTAHVLENVRPGFIVLMHVMYDAREPSREALDPILEGLSEQGYRFVTVSDLLALR